MSKQGKSFFAELGDLYSSQPRKQRIYNYASILWVVLPFALAFVMFFLHSLIGKFINLNELNHWLLKLYSNSELLSKHISRSIGPEADAENIFSNSWYWFHLAIWSNITFYSAILMGVLLRLLFKFRPFLTPNPTENFTTPAFVVCLSMVAFIFFYDLSTFMDGAPYNYSGSYDRKLASPFFVLLFHLIGIITINSLLSVGLRGAKSLDEERK